MENIDLLKLTFNLEIPVMRNIFRFTSVIILLALFMMPSLSLAQNLPAMERVVKAYLNENGGIANVDKLRSLKMSGNWMQEGKEYSLMLIKRRPDFSRLIVSKGLYRLDFSHDGKIVWMNIGTTALDKLEEVKGLEGMDFIWRSTFVSPIIANLKKKVTSEDAADAKVEEKEIKFINEGVELMKDIVRFDDMDCYQFKVKSNICDESIVYLQIGTYREVGRKKVDIVHGLRREVVLHFSDFTQVNKVWIARKIKTNVDYFDMRKGLAEMTVGTYCKDSGLARMVADERLISADLKVEPGATLQKIADDNGITLQKVVRYIQGNSKSFTFFFKDIRANTGVQKSYFNKPKS